MTRDEAVAIMKQTLGFRTDLDTECVTAMVRAQAEFEGAQTLPWFLKYEDYSFSTVAGTASYAKPTGFLKWDEDDMPHFLDSDTDSMVYLPKMKKDDAIISYYNSESNRPNCFVEKNSTIVLYPTPDSVYTISYSYFKSADGIAALSGGGTNAWLTNNPYRLIGRAGLILASDLENKASQERFAEMFATWTAWEKREIAQREESGRPTVMGRNH